jgi:hypothetical protein
MECLGYHFERLLIFQKFSEFLGMSHLTSKFLHEFPVEISDLCEFLQTRVAMKSMKSTLQQALMPLASLHQFESSEEVLARLLQEADANLGIYF